MTSFSHHRRAIPPDHRAPHKPADFRSQSRAHTTPMTPTRASLQETCRYESAAAPPHDRPIRWSSNERDRSHRQSAPYRGDVHTTPSHTRHVWQTQTDSPARFPFVCQNELRSHHRDTVCHATSAVPAWDQTDPSDSAPHAERGKSPAWPARVGFAPTNQEQRCRRAPDWPAVVTSPKHQFRPHNWPERYDAIGKSSQEVAVSWNRPSGEFRTIFVGGKG